MLIYLVFNHLLLTSITNTQLRKCVKTEKLLSTALGRLARLIQI